MYGRLGSIYLLHLAEAGAQRRRLVQSYPGAQCAGNAAEMSLAVFLRLGAVLCVGFCALAVLTVMVG